MPRRFAPVREDGAKPYLVTVTHFGRSHERVIYAANVAEAVYEAKGRQLYTSASARRATIEDVDRWDVSTTGDFGALPESPLPVPFQGER